MKHKNEFFFVNGDQELILGTPNGERFALKADDAGALSMTNAKTGEAVAVGGGSGGAAVLWINTSTKKVYKGEFGDTQHHLTASEFKEMMLAGPVRFYANSGNDNYATEQTPVSYFINASTSRVTFVGTTATADPTTETINVVFASE